MKAGYVKEQMKMLSCTLFVIATFCLHSIQGEGTFAASFRYTPPETWKDPRLIAFYKSKNVQISFDEANAFCENYTGGILVNIAKNELQPLIDDQLRMWTSEIDESLGNKAAYWGGATGTTQYDWNWLNEGGYIPTSGHGTEDQSENWESGQPQCTSGSCYLRISAQNNTLGQWFAANSPTTDGWGSYICQMDPCEPPCEESQFCVPQDSEIKCRSKDACEEDVCKNGASCNSVGLEYTCNCTEGWTGKTCEKEVCEPNPCLNMGTCAVNGSDYNCNCGEGYYGKDCENDPCSADPCEGRGNCTVTGASFQCECENQYAGETCELEPCADNTCENGGTCQVSETTYECTCPDLFTGNTCEYEVCSGSECQNNGTCIKIDDTSTGCECKEGYLGDLCELVPCHISGCHNNGTCNMSDGSYLCVCTEGYSGDSCEIAVASPWAWWIWVIIGVGGFLVICLIIATVCLLHRKGCCQKSKIPKSPSTFSLGDVENNTYAEIDETNVIPAPALLSRYKELTRNDCAKLRKQFENELSTASLLLKSASATGQLKENRRNNRMGSILPYDFNRVILSFQGSSYINASFINGFSHKHKFIATQAPLPNTVGDFWGMIWEQKSKIVVMLNNMIENDNIVCDKYWPQLSYSSMYGPVNVRTVEERLMSGYVMRKMEICLQTDVMYRSVTKIVTHLQLLDWPEDSVPLSTTAIVRLHSHMQRASLNQRVESPIVVHCSNGTGRTGTFIAYDYLLEEMRDKMYVDCFECVRQLRGQRMGLVKSEDEYILLHKLITEAHELGDSDCDLRDLEKKLKRMARKMSYRNRESEYEMEYNKIDLIKPLVTAQTVAKMDINVNKNLTTKVLPYDYSRLTLPSMKSNPNPAYYNASVLNVSCFTGVTIAAQGPTYDTLIEFWHAVWHRRISTIIMLSKAGDNKKCVDYWPSTVGQPATFGDVTITMMKEKGEQIVERNFALNFFSERHDILHLQVDDWTERIDGNNAVLDLVDYLHQNSQIGSGTLLVHCSDGAGRTGTFISILELMSRAKREGRVDVLRTVKDLRDRRPGMVSSIGQYRFLYEVMRDYAAWMERNANKIIEEDD